MDKSLGFFRDILVIRDIVRKTYMMYYAQENLLHLKGRQVAENRLMNDIEAFGKVCFRIYSISTDLQGVTLAGLSSEIQRLDEASIRSGY